MANGRPGDHPLTDILNHGMQVFGPGADALIRQIVKLGGARHLERPPLDLLALDPRVCPGADLEAMTSDLRSLRDRLKAEAEARGWEVEE